ncbi:MAG: hypothetical protein M0R75_13775 [Dehalococcoidia bacterium]|nr:hypothetical protein [Dehalococcoidia bacterium]
MDTETWMGTMGMIFVLVLLGMGLWFVGSMGRKGMDMQQAKHLAEFSAEREQAYRELAQQAARAQTDIAEQLKHLAGIEARLAEVERMLREVDEPAVAR